MPIMQVGPMEVLVLRGSPEAMGEEHGRLMGPRIRALRDNYFKKSLDNLGVPYELIHESARVCDEFIPEEYRAETAATARAAEMDYADLLAMNCVVDADAHAMESAYHCCNFVVSPPATREGMVFHGRNLDFPHGGALNQAAIVMVRVPEGAGWLPTIAAGWVGLVGVLTGMNAAQITVAEVGVPARDTRLDGVPIGFAMRSVLERAASLEEGYDRLKGTRRTCGYNLAMCDGKTGAAWGIETTSRLCERRRGLRGVLVVDDVCMCKKTGENRLSHAAGAFRHARMVQLIGEHYGRIDVGTALAFLGDKYDMARGISHGRTYNCICNQDTVQSVLFLPAERRALIAHGKVPAPSGGYTEVEFDKLL